MTMVTCHAMKMFITFWQLGSEVDNFGENCLSKIIFVKRTVKSLVSFAPV